MLASIMYLINFIIIFIDAILLISNFIGTRTCNMFYLIIVLIISLLNLLALKSQNKEIAKNELIIYNLIKKISKLLKDDNFKEIYKILKEFRISPWYKNIEKDSNIYKSNFQIEYGQDEYRIDFYE